MRATLFGLAAIVTTGGGAPAIAGIDLGPVTLYPSAALVSDYRFRGVSRSDEDVAIQGGIELVHDSGLYAGGWGSSLGGSDLFGDAEINAYGGWSGEIASGFTFDGGVRYYAFTGENALADDDYIEPRASLSYAIGPAELTTGVSYAIDALGQGDNVYVYSDIAVGVPSSPVTLTGHIGYTDGPLALVADGDAIDWSLGARAAFGPVTVGLNYVDTDIPGPFNDNADSTVVGSIGVSF